MKILSSKIITEYKPRIFGREYFEIGGSIQYPMFVATALGVKPVFDDWVFSDKLDKIVEICNKYGLFVEPNVIFTYPTEKKSNIKGGSLITTTLYSVKPYSKELKEGSVHILVSKSKEKILEAKKYSWYPVIVKDSLLNKPFVDHLRYGECLGFPPCCIDFFRRFNNWKFYSHPFETFKNTRFTDSKFGSYYCNNFFMDYTYSLIHHIPCSYNCNKTIELAKKVEEKILEVEPEFVDKARIILKKPLLVFAERDFVIFDGKLRGDKLEYTDCEYIKNPARPEKEVNFFDSILSGNKLTMENNTIIIKDNNSLIESIEKKPEWFLMGFD